MKKKKHINVLSKRCRDKSRYFPGFEEPKIAPVPMRTLPQENSEPVNRKALVIKTIIAISSGFLAIWLGKLLKLW